MVKVQLDRSGSFVGKIEDVSWDTWMSQDETIEQEGLVVEVDAFQYPIRYSASKTGNGKIVAVSNAGVFLERLYELGFPTDEEFDTNELIGHTFAWAQEEIGEGDWARTIRLPQELIKEAPTKEEKEVEEVGEEIDLTSYAGEAEETPVEKAGMSTEETYLLTAVHELGGKSISRDQVFNELLRRGYGNIIASWKDIKDSLKDKGRLRENKDGSLSVVEK